MCEMLQGHSKWSNVLVIVPNNREIVPHYEHSGLYVHLKLQRNIRHTGSGVCIKQIAVIVSLATREICFARSYWLS